MTDSLPRTGEFLRLPRYLLHVQTDAKCHSLVSNLEAKILPEGVRSSSKIKYPPQRGIGTETRVQTRFSYGLAPEKCILSTSVTLRKRYILVERETLEVDHKHWSDVLSSDIVLGYLIASIRYRRLECLYSNSIFKIVQG